MSLRSEVIRIYNELIAGAKKISGLTAAGALDGSELVEIVQNGTNVKTTTQDIADLGGGGGGGGTVESVTGDGVDNTDPDNPVLSFPDAADVSFTPAGNIAATDVQAAIEELDTEKQTAAQVQTIADAKVTQTITNGVTSTSPSEDAVFDALALKAPLASPTFTGTPAAPTPSANDNSTKIATTAYVQGELTTTDESELSLITTFQFLTN